MPFKKSRKPKRNKVVDRNNKTQSNSDNKLIEITLNFETSPVGYFLQNVSFQQHYDAQKNFRLKYISTIFQLLKHKVDILPNAKVKALACAWARNDLELSKTLLSLKKVFNFVEVHRAVITLDVRRQIKALETKINKLEKMVEEKKCVVKDKTFTKLKSKIKVLNGIKLEFGSVSGALARHIREWVRGFNKQELEFMITNFDTKQWRELADVVHFNPSNDFKDLPWFLPYCFGVKAPEDSVLNKIQLINKDNINEMLKDQKLPYHTVCQYRGELTDESKRLIVEAEDTVGRAIWWYEEIECKEVDEAIHDRLKSGETVDIGYGKLMERLMMLKRRKNAVSFYPLLMSLAEQKLKEYKHNLAGPIAVLADASGSMEVAIKIATIVSSFITVFTEAELSFFNEKCWHPDKMPGSIEDVIQLALNTRACNCTSPAAALWPIYENKRVFKTIIVVTDEEENTQCHNYYFAPLFKKYIEEVVDCNIIFISFLEQNSKGKMVNSLQKLGIQCSQYVLNGRRPDIGKLDNIIGRMSLNEAAFVENLTQVEQMLKELSVDGLVDMFAQLKFCD